MTNGPVAAIDCGTNSTRLLVCDADGNPLERLLRITRLGQGVDATGRLDPEAIARTAAVLAEFRTVMDRRGVERGRLTATSAARDAVNAEEFFDAARRASGLEPELLAGEDEGATAFLGATRDLSPSAGPQVVVDVGGGSTELVAGTPGSPPWFVTSLDMGCVRFTEKLMPTDPPTAVELVAARDAVRILLDGARDAARRARGEEGDPFGGHGMIGLAGTVTSLAAMSMGLDEYDPDAIHHFRLRRDEAVRLAAEMCAETAEQRRTHRGLEKGRADVIAAGALIVSTVMDHLDFPDCLVSESDILDGLIAGQL